VSSGGTVTLTCTVEDNDNSSLQWSNTAQQTLYFGEKRALRDNRIQLVKSTPTELSISISDVELLDEGEYTCSIFTMPVRTARATVTVLGVPQKPRISGNTDPVEDGGKLKLTCTTSGSKPPARLRWWKEGQELEGFPSTVESDPDGRSFKVTSDIVLTVTKSDNHATIRCSVDHESMPSAEKFTEEKIEVLCELRTTPPIILCCCFMGNVFFYSISRPLLDLNTIEFAFVTERKKNRSFYDSIVDFFLVCENNRPFFNTVSHSLSLPSPSPLLSPSPFSPSYHQSNHLYHMTSIDHAVIGGVVAVIVFIVLCLLIVLGRYLIRHKGTYLTHEAKGSDDAPDADTAIINAEAGQSGAEDKKEYFI
ncbi:CADM3 protein, partial [Polyodon spathula]|nr:CADM3 protein [Polyodon spathula]